MTIDLISRLETLMTVLDVVVFPFPDKEPEAYKLYQEIGREYIKIDLGNRPQFEEFVSRYEHKFNEIRRGK